MTDDTTGIEQAEKFISASFEVLTRSLRRRAVSTNCSTLPMSLLDVFATVCAMPRLHAPKAGRQKHRQ